MDGNVLLGRRVKVTINGKPYLVEVMGSLVSTPVTVKVNGQPYVVNVEAEQVITRPILAPGEALDTIVRETAAPPKAPAPAGPAGPLVPSLRDRCLASSSKYWSGRVIGSNMVNL